ncbi:homocysteine S-methyltransferase [Sporolactobacillus shoreae]|uniref:S-methylmethionine:homocysteine methyltransferase n=1 Tax=Sporolactobacillus shoreae TaxID=1465501 RepID=A0A4Z0GM36_9BACL|nr:homocysteine S-methyltransferase [Sporolactobacillus shoreae]TGA96802.1 homocysteine S-methyltransferase [Sporolactobacillus shoreae]
MKTDPIGKLLNRFNTVILDGAMATELEKQGVDTSSSLWSAQALIDHPDLIKKVHMDYFKAGADMATTNTYQANLAGFQESGWSEAQAEHFIKQAVLIARETRDEFWNNLSDSEKKKRPRPLVAGSVGPYGAYLADGSEYTGNYHLSEEAFRRFHLPRMKLLKEANADLFAFETIPNFEESRALAALLETDFPDDYAWLSFSISDDHLCDGTSLQAAVPYFNDYPQICAIGVNCASADLITPIIEIVRTLTDKPIVVYPNSGEEYDPATKTWHNPGRHNEYGVLSKQWHEEGAKLIGGCCRTCPEDIHKIYSWARA